MTNSYQVAGLHVDKALPPGGAPANRPPLLLVHGAAHGAWCWELWMDKLPSLGWEAHALSLRNHPGSYEVDRETFQRKLRIDDYADDVAAVADRIRRPVIVVGHSLGGIVAQRFAARQTAAGAPPAGLVLLASAPPGQLGPSIATPFPADQPFFFDRETLISRYFLTTPPERLERTLERLVPESTSAINEVLTAPGVSVAAEEITCPVLAITAAKDNSSVPRDRSLADYYGADYYQDPENGHDLMLEEGWEPLLIRLLEWAESRVAGT